LAQLGIALALPVSLSIAAQGLEELALRRVGLEHDLAGAPGLVDLDLVEQAERRRGVDAHDGAGGNVAAVAGAQPEGVQARTVDRRPEQRAVELGVIVHYGSSTVDPVVLRASRSRWAWAASNNR